MPTYIRYERHITFLYCLILFYKERLYKDYYFYMLLWKQLKLYINAHALVTIKLLNKKIKLKHVAIIKYLRNRKKIKHTTEMFC